MPKILVVNGPNMNLLGMREPDKYGHAALDEINARLKQRASDAGVDLVFFQSNHEGEMIDFIHREGRDADGMIINPAAYTTTSYAIRDAIAAVGIKTVEVHVTNIFAREEFRQRSVVAPVCDGQVAGLGERGYELALLYFVEGKRK